VVRKHASAAAPPPPVRPSTNICFSHTQGSLQLLDSLSRSTCVHVSVAEVLVGCARQSTASGATLGAVSPHYAGGARRASEGAASGVGAPIDLAALSGTGSAGGSPPPTTTTTTTTNTTVPCVVAPAKGFRVWARWRVWPPWFVAVGSAPTPPPLLSVLMPGCCGARPLRPVPLLWGGAFPLCIAVPVCVPTCVCACLHVPVCACACWGGAASSGPRYLLLDCRPKDEFELARLPTAFHVNPELLLDPEALEGMVVAFQSMQARAPHLEPPTHRACIPLPARARPRTRLHLHVPDVP
jgi:hypothetical protein